MIKFENVTKKYKTKEVIHGLDLEIPDGKLVSIIGSSGCGKTTMLKMINRLVPITSGTISINGKNIQDTPPVELRKQIGYVIQQTGLFPHMTIEENIALPMLLHKWSAQDIATRMKELLNMVSLSRDMLHRFPPELSGGQQQRVGVARAFSTNPDIILMDEPFSALDPITRNNLQEELNDLQKELLKTIVFVTHDMDEAIKISDTICLMRNGSIEQLATPEELLKNPANDFVETFIGKNRIWSSPEFIKAKDIMVENIPTCGPKTSLLGCLEKMRSEVLDYILVRNRLTNEFLGVLTAGMLRDLTNYEGIASDIMGQPVLTLSEHDSLVEILQKINDHNRPYLIVLNENKVATGIITRKSLIAILGKQYISDDSDEGMVI
jgi:osmoprotectant transport system ATP-binding protein